MGNWPVRRSPVRQAALAKGFRSGLEDKVATELQATGVPFDFEKFKVQYLVPARKAKYTPDFHLLRNGIVIETKGQFVTADRQKHILIKAQHPDLDIRFVFSNPKTKIRKGSPTTYSMWCDTHGFLWAGKSIPQEWIAEDPDESRFAAVRNALNLPDPNTLTKA